MWPTPSAEQAGEGDLLNKLQTKEGEPARQGERAYNPDTGGHVQMTLNRAVQMFSGSNQVDESTMLSMLDNAKSVFLLEPPYRRKYIPLGLAKISSYLKERGKEVAFGREYNSKKYDLVCCTSLFTYESESVLKALWDLRFWHHGPILIGGIFATLMPDKLPEDVHVFPRYSKTLDSYVPDYSINWRVDKPWDEYSFTFTTRGCPNKCAYCAVWRLEPELWINPNWRAHIVDEKPFAMVSDNNLSAQPSEHLFEVVDYLAEKKKKVVFDNGLDCKLITPEKAKKLATLKYARTGLRLAFDRIEEDGIFQDAIHCLLKHGVSKSNIMAYVIFNFKDTPKEADYRMRECVKLGIRPYPQQYTPLNTLNRYRPYIGKHWTPNLVKVFRHFWLMAGYFTKMEFEDFMMQSDKLTEEDWNAWRG